MRDSLAVALLTLGSTHADTLAAELPIVDVEVRVHSTYVGGIDTQVPHEFSIPMEDLGTGGGLVDNREADLVANAARYVQAIAVIPTSAHDEDLIDAFIDERRAPRASEPL